MIDSVATMDEQELVQRRRARRQRIVKTNRRRKSALFFSSPTAAVVCMLVALGSIVGFWRGVPSWALLGLGVGAVLIVVLTGFFWRSNKK